MSNRKQRRKMRPASEPCTCPIRPVLDATQAAQLLCERYGARGAVYLVSYATLEDPDSLVCCQVRRLLTLLCAAAGVPFQPPSQLIQTMIGTMTAADIAGMLYGFGEQIGDGILELLAAESPDSPRLADVIAARPAFRTPAQEVA